MPLPAVSSSWALRTAGLELPESAPRPGLAQSLRRRPRKQNLCTLAEFQARNEYLHDINEKKRAKEQRQKNTAAQRQARLQAVANMDLSQMAEVSRLVRQHRKLVNAEAAAAKALQQEIEADQRAAAKEAAAAARREAALAKAASSQSIQMVRLSYMCAMTCCRYDVT